MDKFSKITKWLSILLYVLTVIQVVSMLSGYLQYQLFHEIKLGVIIPDVILNSTYEKTNYINFIFMIVYLITIVLFLRWIYIASSNARQLSANNMKFTPGWSIGYYFIPIANFWMPYKAMQEIYQVSKNSPYKLEISNKDSILPIWWGFFILTGLLSQIALRATLNAKNIDDFLYSTIISIISDFSGIILNIIAILLITKIYNMQVTNFNKHDI